MLARFTYGLLLIVAGFTFEALDRLHVHAVRFDPSDRPLNEHDEQRYANGVRLPTDAEWVAFAREPMSV